MSDAPGTPHPAAARAGAPAAAAPSRVEMFTPEHAALRSSLRRFVAERLAPVADGWETDGIPDWVLPELGRHGFLALSWPEGVGGQGGDYLANLVLAEELMRLPGKSLAMSVSVHTDMATPPILQFGTSEQQQRLLPAAADGTQLWCLGITEPDAGSDVAALRTRASRHDDGWRITGTKTYVTNGGRADRMLMVARTSNSGHHGLSCFVVDLHADGVVRERNLDKLGMHASDTAVLSFNDVLVEERDLVGRPGQGFPQIMWELQGERLITAAGVVAAADAALEQTVEYARERHAFGRPVGQHQAVRHIVADAATRLAAARSLVYLTAQRFASGDYQPRDISMAKLIASRTAHSVVDACLQVHGGAGYMAEYKIERTWRDLRLYRIGAGTDEIMLDVIGKSYGF